MLTIPRFLISGYPDFLQSTFVDCKKGRFLYFSTRCARPTAVRSGEVRLMVDKQIVDDGATDGENKSLNFKVSADFKKDFKGFAVAQGMTMTDLLKEGFALTKKKRQK